MFRIVSYTVDYCVKPLGLYVQDCVIYSRLLCEAIRDVCSGSCQSYSRLLCEAIRAVCPGSCHIQPTIV